MKRIFCLAVVFSAGLGLTHAGDIEIIVETYSDGLNAGAFKPLEGKWSESAAKSTAPGLMATKSVYNDADTTSAAVAEFRPTIPVDGKYEVFITYSASGNAAGVLYTVNSDEGLKEVRIDQAGRIPEAEKPHSTWISLGSYTFKAGTAGTIQIRDPLTGLSMFDKEPNKRIYADAIRLVPQGFALPDNYTNLKPGATETAVASAPVAAMPGLPGASGQGLPPLPGTDLISSTGALPPLLGTTPAPAATELPALPGVAPSTVALPTLPGTTPGATPAPMPALPGTTATGLPTLPGAVPSPAAGLPALPGVTPAASTAGLPALPGAGPGSAAAMPALPAAGSTASSGLPALPGAGLPALPGTTPATTAVLPSLPVATSGPILPSPQNTGAPVGVASLASPVVIRPTPQMTPALSPSSITANNPSGLSWTYDYGSATNAARASNKNLFVFFTAANNKGSETYENVLFQDPAVKSELDKYVLLKIDFPKFTRIGYDLGVYGSGIAAVVHPDGKVITRIDQAPASGAELISKMQAPVPTPVAPVATPVPTPTPAP